MSHQSDLPPHVPSCVSTGAGVTVPDATATPRTRCELHQLNRQEYDTLKSMGLLWEVYPNAPDTFDEIDAPAKSKAKIAQLSKTVLDTIQLDREHHARALKAERELAAAKAEIADIRAVDREIYQESLERLARAERAEAELRERTQWQCKCGGTDCAGQAENERLRAEVTKLKAHEGDLVIGAAILEGARKQEAREVDQLRARVADLENDLEKSKHEADDWHRAWETVTEQAKKEVAELEADKARLDWLEKSFNDDPIAKVPTWFSVFCDVAQEGPHPAPGQSLRAAIDAARAGKGAT